MKYKLVQFRDGRFGARTWFFGYKYLDVKDYQYTWRQPAHVHRYCKGTHDQALNAIAVMSDKGTPV